MKVETWLPIFPGFYNTIFQYNEEYDIDSYNEENNTDLGYDDFEFDYKDYEIRVSKEVTKIIEKLLKEHIPVKIEFQELYSPRFYNYGNDVIYCEIDIVLDDLIGYINNNNIAFKKYLRDRYVSAPGFISHFDCTLEVWLSEYLSEDYEKLNHVVGAVLDFVLRNEGVTILDLYDDIEDEQWINYEPIKTLEI